MKNEILSEIYKSQELKKCLNFIKNEALRDDIKNEIFLKLCEKPETFIIDLHQQNKIKAYIATAIFNEQYSPRSKMRKLLGKESNIFKDSVETEKITIFDKSYNENEIENKAIDFFENIPNTNLEKKVYLLLQKKGSYRKLAAELNISHTTLQSIVDKFINNIKNKIK